MKSEILFRALYILKSQVNSVLIKTIIRSLSVNCNFTRVRVFQMEDETFVIHTEVCRKLPLLRDTLPLSMFTTKSRIKKPISTEEMVCV